MFTDISYDIRNDKSIENIDSNKGKVIIKRLGHLYSKNHRPDFFPK